MSADDGGSAAEAVRTLAVDIGGTGLKMLVLNRAGEAITERTRVLTPAPSTPDSVLDALEGMLGKHGPFDRASVGFPGVVVGGVVQTAPNLDKSWPEFRLAETFSARAGVPVRVANDADVQGFGAISGKGVELVITLGTGVGSALFVDGRLVPNLELGHHPYHKGQTYEDRLGKVALKARGKKAWNRRLKRAIGQWRHTFNFNHLYVGGGNAKHIRFGLPDGVTQIENVAGLLGGIALWES